MKIHNLILIIILCFATTKIFACDQDGELEKYELYDIERAIIVANSLLIQILCQPSFNSQKISPLFERFDEYVSVIDEACDDFPKANILSTSMNERLKAIKEQSTTTKEMGQKIKRLLISF